MGGRFAVYVWQNSFYGLIGKILIDRMPSKYLWLKLACC